MTTTTTTTTTTTFYNSTITPISGLRFYSGNSIQSASVIGSVADFLFTISTGIYYVCTVDFGDGSPKVIFQDQPYNLNNTIVNHTFSQSQETVYRVYIICVNNLNNQSLYIDHYTQKELYGLQLIKTSGLINTIFSIDFMILSGSSPHFLESYVDSILDGVSKDTSSIGPSEIFRGSLRNPQSVPLVYLVFINMSNYVSNLKLNTTFKINSIIINPTFSIQPIAPFFTYEYIYNSNQFSFLISMDSGSNVEVTIFTGDEPSYSKTANILIETIGNWNNGISNVKHTYANPGDFEIMANISNSFSYFMFRQKITIISRVDDLIPSLLQSPVIFFINSGKADFQFVYNGTKAGSHAVVTFWPGDLTNNSYGPFKLGMDFDFNISRVPLSYKYKLPGTYECSFLVSNPLGSKVFTLKVVVVVGMYGFYIDVNPKYAYTNQLVDVSAFMIQGNNVDFHFFQNGNSIASQPRACNRLIFFKLHFSSIFGLGKNLSENLIIKFTSSIIFKVLKNYNFKKR